uniref:Protein rolling stone n=1 Tax=Timema tahoe TaxID=61484 RepID=A0A7R9IE37_9NEOP|nr:unnamed protein product [Timema tahoe]
MTYSSPMASLVLTDSSQLTADGFEKLPDQIMYPYAEPYDLQKACVVLDYHPSTLHHRRACMIDYPALRGQSHVDDRGIESTDSKQDDGGAWVNQFRSITRRFRVDLFSHQNVVTLKVSPMRVKEMMKRVWRKEFLVRILRLDHERPEDFLTCQWQKQPGVSIAFLVYRWALALFFMSALICSVVDAGRNVTSKDSQGVRYLKWLIYLTNWGYTVCTLQAFLAACLLTRKLVQERTAVASSDAAPSSLAMSRSYRVYWALHTIAIIVAFGVSIIYWATIYNPEVNKVDAVNLLVHAFNSLLMLLDLALVSFPFHLLHIFLPVLFTLIYIIFTVIYYLAGGTNKDGKIALYPILDWENPKRSSIVCVLALLFLLFLHLITWLLSLLRCWAHQHLGKNKSELKVVSAASGIV